MLLSTLFLLNSSPHWFLSQTLGSCEENNLRFETFRINKIPLSSNDSSQKLEARFLIYFKNDQTYKARYQENEILSCTTTAEGETCSSQTIFSQKFEGSWTFENDKLSIEKLGSGIVESYNNIPILNFHFSTSSFPKVDGKDRYGWMVQINTDEDGKSALSLCTY